MAKFGRVNEPDKASRRWPRQSLSFLIQCDSQVGSSCSSNWRGAGGRTCQSRYGRQRSGLGSMKEMWKARHSGWTTNAVPIPECNGAYLQFTFYSSSSGS